MKSLKFYRFLKKNKINFFTGVPDSLLKPFISHLSKYEKVKNHIIAANEGTAIGLAIGYNLATNKVPLVYMQNSGLGNAVNPILSLADKKVYSIPLLLVIGWRGKPGTLDEPQHITQGAVTQRILKSINIPYLVVNEDTKLNEIKNLIIQIRKNSLPGALLVTKDAILGNTINNYIGDKYELSREEAIKKIVDNLRSNEIIVSTTGMASRELFEYVKSSKKKIGHFLTVGGMGHSSQIATGIALHSKKKPVVCLDGDGSLIMHLGSLSTIGSISSLNMKHFILNNGVHGSVGDQKTSGFKIDFIKIAKACGYDYSFRCNNKKNLLSVLKKINNLKGSILIEVKINRNYRTNLGRPDKSPVENKKDFKKYLQEKNL